MSGDLQDGEGTFSRKRSSVCCNHCGLMLCTKTYKRHKKLYFNEETRTWITDSSFTVMSNAEGEVQAAGHGVAPELPIDLESETYPGSAVSYTSADDDDVKLVNEVENSETESGSDSSDNEELWESSVYSMEDDEFFEECLPPPLPQHATNPPNNSIVRWLVGFILILQAKHYIPDTAINALLKFLSVFLKVLGFDSAFIASIASSMPSSTYLLKKYMKQPDIIYLVVCRKCHKLYRFDECIAGSSSVESQSKLCSFIRFPNHTQLRFRRVCGQPLLKTVYFNSGRKIFYPFKVFPYKCLASSLQDLLLRPGFFDLCQHWKSVKELTVNLEDIYDGKIWKEFQVFEGTPFLSGPCGLGVAINIDWFQPYKFVTCSVGVIFLSIMNLPRSIRFKRENIILVGILPGPTEPKSNVNSYIEPLVDELFKMWTGVLMQVHTNSQVVRLTVRCALLCVACDLPAGRKLCGFMGHTAKLGCSKCLKEFRGQPGSMNYSGFDRSLWLKRNNRDHREKIQRILKCKTKQEETNLESSLGCRYSSLLKLPYFDFPRMLTIDPMHNLFLGTGKHMLQLWMMHGIIGSEHFEHLQERIDNVVVPTDVGRIPQKVVTGFSGFTADQLKNWITIYSIPVLHGILPRVHLECWRLFVLACRILCKRKLCRAEIDISDALLLKFCNSVQDIYGERAITPNMHMHGHIKEVVEDYGPVYSFWLFSYERCNGILGNQPNNNRAIEPQLMNRFLKDNFAYSFNFPEEYFEDFHSVCSISKPELGSLGENLLAESSLEYSSRCTRGILDKDDTHFVACLYAKLYPDHNNVVVNSAYLKYTSIRIKGELFNCCKSNRRYRDSQYIAIAEWDEAVFGEPPTPLLDAGHPDSKYRPVTIQYYIKVSVSRGQNTSHLTIAVVLWNKPHESKNLIGKPTQIWSHNQFESGGIISFLPVRYVKYRCASTVDSIGQENVLIITPILT